MLDKLIGYLLKSRLQIARTNLRLAFPELDESQINQILSSSLSFWKTSFIEIVTLRVFSKTWLESFVTIDNYSGLKSRLEKGGVILSAHYGNFEILPQLSAQINLPIHFLAKPIKPTWLDYFIKKLRQANGAVFVNNLKKAFDAIKQGNTVGFLFDQHSSNKASILSDFFGVQCSTSPLVWRLAKLSKAQPLFCWITREGSTHVVRWTAVQADNPTQLVSELLCRLETLIKRHPEQWWWFHRRWKNVIRYDT